MRYQIGNINILSAVINVYIGARKMMKDINEYNCRFADMSNEMLVAWLWFVERRDNPTRLTITGRRAYCRR